MGNRQDALAEALAVEQAIVSMLYGRLDAARERSESVLGKVHGLGGAVANTQGRVEREVVSSERSHRLAQLYAVERGLCFGRIDDTAGTTTYVAVTRATRRLSVVCEGELPSVLRNLQSKGAGL